ncbi:MAG: hypothetical protein EOS34_17345 [Mesorhizobium sp.]|nr:MAG: hypothetical protein EOS34_17345 [Mesorhizobium sp.]
MNFTDKVVFHETKSDMSVNLHIQYKLAADKRVVRRLQRRWLSFEVRNHPPASPSSFWIALLMPADKSNDIIANMELLYQEKWLPKYGVRRANWIWKTQALQVIVRRWAWPITFIVGAIKALKIG